MKVLKSALIKGASITASIALIVAAISNSSACGFIYHQPKVPARLNELKKI
jgi:cyclic lactone autoinducer peptide